MPNFRLTLFVTGGSARANAAISNLRAICAKHLGDDYEVSVVDVLREPERAEESRVMATPTLIRDLPPPVRRVIGDLSDGSKVLLALDITKTEPKERSA